MSNIKKPTRNVSGVGAITPLYQSGIDRKIQPTCGHSGVEWNEHGECITCARDRVLGSDIDRKIDELLAKYQIGFVVGDKDVNEHIAKFKQALIALINEARIDEIVRVLQQPYISAHLYGQARIAQLKPDTTLEGGK